MNHNAENALNKQSWLSSQLDAPSGAHPSGTTQWKDSNGYVHLIQLPGNMMDIHFEGHPTGVDVTQVVLHMADATRDKASGRAAAEKRINQREESIP